jgi:hypothetical protein
MMPNRLEERTALGCAATRLFDGTKVQVGFKESRLRPLSTYRKKTNAWLASRQIRSTVHGLARTP